MCGKTTFYFTEKRMLNQILRFIHVSSGHLYSCYLQIPTDLYIMMIGVILILLKMSLFRINISK